MAAPTTGWLIYPPPGELQELAQRVVCWSQHDKRVQVGTWGGTHLIVPFEVCEEIDEPLVLTPGGTEFACQSGVTPTGWITVSNLAAGDVSGINANSCAEVDLPTGLAVSGTPTTTAITVAWTAPDEYTPTGYRLGYKTNAGSVWTYVDVAAGVTSRAVTGLTINTAYNFKVQAKNGDVLSPFTAPVTISTAAA